MTDQVFTYKNAEGEEVQAATYRLDDTHVKDSYVSIIGNVEHVLSKLMDELVFLEPDDGHTPWDAWVTRNRPEFDDYESMLAWINTLESKIREVTIARHIALHKGKAKILNEIRDVSIRILGEDQFTIKPIE